MTSRGVPAPDQRPRRTRALALLGALIVSAGLATWAEVHYAGDDGPDQGSSANGSLSQDSLVAPAGGGDPSAAPSALPEAGGILPATINVPGSVAASGAASGSRTTAPGGSAGFAGFQATRYALGTSANCTDALAANPPAGVTTSCEGILTASYVSADHSVIASITVLGYPDAATARRARPLFGSSTMAGLVATFRQPGNELPGVSANPGAEEQRVQQIGRFVTIVQAASVTGAPVPPPAALLATEYSLSAQVGDSVLWDD